jgi:hypothetical protein
MYVRELGNGYIFLGVIPKDTPIIVHKNTDLSEIIKSSITLGLDFKIKIVNKDVMYIKNLVKECIEKYKNQSSWSNERRIKGIRWP